MALYNRQWAGVGRLVDYDSDGILFLDIDNCFGGDGSLEPFARDIVERARSYTERSPSGKGLRIAFRARLPEDLKRNCSAKLWCKGLVPGLPDVEVQLFIRRQYGTLTGNTIGNERGVVLAQTFLDDLISQSPWNLREGRRGSQPAGAVRPVQAASGDIEDVLAVDLKLANHSRVKQLHYHMLKTDRIYNDDWHRVGRPGATSSELQWNVFSAFYVRYQPPVNDLAYLIFLWCEKHGIKFEPHRLASWLPAAKGEFEKSGRISYKQYQAARQRNYRLRTKDPGNPNPHPNTVKISDIESGLQGLARKHRGTGARLKEIKDLQVQGLSNTQISDALGISRQAVHQHLLKSNWATAEPGEGQMNNASDPVPPPDGLSASGTDLNGEPRHEARSLRDPSLREISQALEAGLRSKDRHANRANCDNSAEKLLVLSKVLESEHLLLRLVRQACRLERSLKKAACLVFDALAGDKRLEFPAVKVYAELFKSRGSISGTLAGGGKARVEFSARESVEQACKLITFAQASGMPECSLEDVRSIWRRFWAAQGIDLGKNLQMLSPRGKRLQDLAREHNRDIQLRAANGAVEKAERHASQLRREDLPVEEMLLSAVLGVTDLKQKSLGDFLLDRIETQVCESDPAIALIADFIQRDGLPGSYRFDRDGTKIPNKFGRRKAVLIASQIMASASQIMASARNWVYRDGYVESAERIWLLGMFYGSLRTAVDVIGMEESVFGPPAYGGRSNPFADEGSEEHAEHEQVAIGRK